MQTVAVLWETSIAKKALMALSGMVLFGFVVVHIAGNLQLFAGPEAINHYAATLADAGALKWTVRIVLAASVLVHATAAFQVWLQSRQARPVRYAVQRYSATDYAARTMIVGGPLIALFVVYHLLHFTTGAVHPHPEGFVPDAAGHIDVYRNVVTGFRDPLAAGVYIAAMLLVGLHLYHGLATVFQSVGLADRLGSFPKKFAVLFAAVVTAAGISLPVSVLAGWIAPV